MTKKQKKIYKWLIARPGYLKKSVDSFIDKYPHNIDYGDAIVVLKEARLVTNKSKKKNKKQAVITVVDRAIEVIPAPTPTKFVRNLTTPGLYFIFGCVHAPFHNERAFTAVFRLLNDCRESVVGIILAGDFLDMNSLSSHDRGKKPIPGATLAWEYAEGNVLLDTMFANLAPNIHKVFIYGNHEDRYFRYMNDVDNSKLGDALPSPETGLNLNQRGFVTLTNWKEDRVTLGNHLDVSHGEFINVHTAKKHIDTYRRSTLFFHTHRVQQYIEGSVGGYNGGSMADFNEPIFNYASRAMKGSWLNGFTAVHVDINGFYHVQQIVCYNNRFVFGNKTYIY